MADYNQRIEDSVDHADAKKAAQLLTKLYLLTRHKATVKKTISPGIYEVSIGVLGLNNIRCYNTWGSGPDTYKDNATILVTVDETGIAFILRNYYNSKRRITYNIYIYSFLVLLFIVIFLLFFIILCFFIYIL